MNNVISDIPFYSKEANGIKTKTDVIEVRKTFISCAMEECKIDPRFHKDISSDITIKVNTPLLRSPCPQHIVFKADDSNNALKKYFPRPKNYSTFKSKGPSDVQPNLHKNLHKMSISRRKFNSGQKAQQIEESPERFALEGNILKQVKNTKRDTMLKAINFLRTYASHIKTFLIKHIKEGSKNNYLDYKLPRTPNPMKTIRPIEHFNFTERIEAPITEKKKMNELISDKLIIFNSESQNIKESKRKFTPDSFTRKTKKRTKTTFAAIEKLAFEPLIV